jgi:hypothetical protein
MLIQVYEAVAVNIFSWFFAILNFQGKYGIKKILGIVIPTYFRDQKLLLFATNEQEAK